MISKVCVYCASSDKIDSSYFDGARELGKILATNKISTIYGGGSAGLMGCLADSALKHGGTVIGIIPHFMMKVEWHHDQLTELILVEDMHERKKLLLEDTDALVALPGGCGTLEELLEAITLKRLGVFVKPIIIFNQNGYYAPLIAMLEKAIEENFMGKQHRDIWSVVDKVEDILEAIENAPYWDETAILHAKI